MIKVRSTGYGSIFWVTKGSIGSVVSHPLFSKCVGWGYRTVVCELRSIGKKGLVPVRRIGSCVGFRVPRLLSLPSSDEFLSVDFVFPTVLGGVYVWLKGELTGRGDGYLLRCDKARLILESLPEELISPRAEWLSPFALMVLLRLTKMGDFTSIVEDRGAVNIYGDRGAGKTFWVLSSLLRSKVPWVYVWYDHRSGDIVVERVRNWKRSIIGRGFSSAVVGENVVLDDVHYLWESELKNELQVLLEKVRKARRIIVITDEPLWYYEQQGLKVPFRYLLIPLPSITCVQYQALFGVDDKGWLPGRRYCALPVECSLYSYVPKSNRLVMCMYAVLGRLRKPYYRNVFALADELGLLDGRERGAYLEYLERLRRWNFSNVHSRRKRYRELVSFLRSRWLMSLGSRVAEKLTGFFLSHC